MRRQDPSAAETPAPPPFRTTVAALLTLLHAAAAVAFLANRAAQTDAALLGFPLDDAWIHMVYGRSVAEHGLPYYNDGQLETGFTSPLWVSCVAAAHAAAALLGVPAWAVVKVVGVALGAVTATAVYHLTWALTRNAAASLLAALAAACSPAAVFAGLSGMEVALAAAALAGAALAFQRRRLRTCSLLLAAGALTRPEALVAVAVALVAVFAARPSVGPSERLRNACQLGLPTAAAMALWSGYCYYATGRPLPATFYQKAASPPLSAWPAAIAEALWAMPANATGAGLALLVAAVLGLRSQRDRPAAALVLAVPLALIAGVAASRELPPGYTDYFAWHRYVQPALPLLLVAMGLGMAQVLRLVRGMGSQAAQREGAHAGAGDVGAHVVARGADAWGADARHAARARLCAFAAALLLGALTLWGYPPALEAAAAKLSWNCQNIREVQVAFGEWLANRTSPRDAVMVNDAGAIRYFSNRKSIDLVGLNCADMLHPSRAGALLRPASMAQLMRMEGARYLVVFPSWFPALVEHESFLRVFAPELSRRSEPYTLCQAERAQSRMWAFRLR